MTTDTRETISHEIGAAGSVEIRGHDGEIELRAVDGTSVRVHAIGDRSLDDAFKIETGPGLFKLSVAESTGFGLHLVGRRSPSIQVEVPRTATVRVDTASGEIRADGLSGRQRYRTATGDVRLESTGGRIAIDTVSGDVRVRSNGGLGIEARTVSGDLDVAAGAIGSLQARTTSGDVRLAGAFDEAGAFGIETVSGDVTISPIGAIRVEATTVSGDVRSSIPHTSGGRAGQRTIELGQGGPVIAFRSISGDLRVTAGEPSDAAGPARPAAPPPPPQPIRPPEPARQPVPTSASASPTSHERTGGGSDEDVRMAVLRELEAGSIDTAEAERRLAALDESVAAAPAAIASAAAPKHLDWVRRV